MGARYGLFAKLGRSVSENGGEDRPNARIGRFLCLQPSSLMLPGPLRGDTTGRRRRWGRRVLHTFVHHLFVHTEGGHLQAVLLPLKGVLLPMMSFALSAKRFLVARIEPGGDG